MSSTTPVYHIPVTLDALRVLASVLDTSATFGTERIAFERAEQLYGKDAVLDYAEFNLEAGSLLVRYGDLTDEQRASAEEEERLLRNELANRRRDVAAQAIAKASEES